MSKVRGQSRSQPDLQKPDRFRQRDPRDQLLATLSSLEGHISNVQDGTTRPQDIASKVEAAIRDLYALGHWLVQEW